MKSKVVAIIGPTAVGKSKIGIDVAKAFNGEIISADSIAVFKEFNIGSAKIMPKQMQGVKHYGIDIVSPSEQFSTFDFVVMAKKAIKKILDQGKLPIIVGGTALYVKALIENYNLGGKVDMNLRETLTKQLEEKGLPFMAERLKKILGEESKEIDLKNPIRVLRALELALSGQNKTKNESEYDCKVFALIKDRQTLYNDINVRVDQMFANGLESEVRALYKKYGVNAQPFKAIGYKEFLPYFKGRCTKEDMINLIKQHSRNYAKRQITFIKSMQNVCFVDGENVEEAEQLIFEEIEKWKA